MNQPLGHCRGQICVVGDCPSSIQKKTFFLNRKLFTWGKGSTILKKSIHVVYGSINKIEILLFAF